MRLLLSLEVFPVLHAEPILSSQQWTNTVDIVKSCCLIIWPAQHHHGTSGKLLDKALSSFFFFRPRHNLVGALQNLESDLRYESCNGIPSVKRSATDGTTKLFDIQAYIGRFRKIKQEMLLPAHNIYEIRYKVDMYCINYYHIYRRIYIE